MVRNTYKPGLAIAVIAGLVLFAGAASAQSVAATGNATILQALTLVEDSELDFGRILADPTLPGSVTLDQSDGQSCAVVTCFNDALSGDFTVTGTAAETVDVTIDANYTLNGSGGGTMSATTDAPATVLIGGGGSSAFGIGGVLTVGAAQTPGTYTGTYNVSVAYQ
jgi:hypothetical protein